MSRSIDMTAKKFGSWTVLELAGMSQGAARLAKWRCVCDCGVQQVVFGSSLRNGKSTKCKSCATKSIALSKMEHGMSRSSTYVSWKAMKSRCLNKSSPDFVNYGGAGITLCERWANSFEAFLSDMGERPEGKSLDRIDNSRGYEPGNCRWATSEEQARNRSSNSLVEFEGERMTISEFAKKAGISRQRARYFLKVKGLDPMTVVKSGGQSCLEK